jgi:light-regulated signal transduction histidine kinase (bacteriophytochrome)
MNAVLNDALLALSVAIRETGARVDSKPLRSRTLDRQQMTLVFQNLISNAIKFNKTQTPVISIGAAEKDRVWTFSVKDNGIGIDPEYREKIFDIFKRLHTRGEYPGTGIGLAICRRIVERHGGKIWVESEPGQGSTFHFTIPKNNT